MTSYPYTLPDETMYPESDQMTLPAWHSNGFYLHHNGGWFHATFDEVTDLFTVLRPLTADERKEQQVDKIREAIIHG